jgi:hypothetical protein
MMYKAGMLSKSGYLKARTHEILTGWEWPAEEVRTGPIDLEKKKSSEEWVRMCESIGVEKDAAQRVWDQSQKGTGGTMNYNNSVVYLLYQQGKRNPVPVLLIQTNPDGTGNFIQVDGSGKFNFILGLPTRAPYGDDANQSYAIRATKVE